jgi:hypothetical protein
MHACLQVKMARVTVVASLPLSTVEKDMMAFYNFC